MGCSHSGVVEGTAGSLGAQGGHVSTEGSLRARWGQWGYSGVIGAQLDGGGGTSGSLGHGEATVAQRGRRGTVRSLGE